jgi:molybdate/tungstate transport system ATP-binding protein
VALRPVTELIEGRFKVKLDQFLLDAEVEVQGFTAVIGPNGAGKTTLLMALAGLRPIAKGVVKVNGVDVTNEPPERRGLVYIDFKSYFPQMEVEDHLRFGARIRGIRLSDDDVSEVIEMLQVPRTGKVGKMSLGNRVRISLATAILSGNKGILVDEVLTSLYEGTKFVSAFKELVKRRGMDVIFTTHVEELSREADRLYFINAGRTTRKF